jgi:hypothetical protein
MGTKSQTEWVLKCSPITPFMKVTLKKEWFTVKAEVSLPEVKFMKVISTVIKWMERAFFNGLTVEFITVISLKERSMDTEYLCGLMASITKVSLDLTSAMGKVSCTTPMARSSKVLGRMVKSTA